MTPDIHSVDNVPSKAEKRKIRKLYNRAAGALAAQYAVMFLLVFIGSIFLSPYIKEEYNTDGYRIIGFAEATISFCAPALASIIVFFIYNHRYKIKTSELFDTSHVSMPLIVKTVGICFLMHQIGYLLQITLLVTGEMAGYEVTGLDFVLKDDAATGLMNIFTSIILAPVAEELLFRGILLRELSRVSTRFAIIFSALMFGLMHSNPYQFILGTLIGMVLGYFTVKSRSLVPAIVGHVAVNTMASVSDIAAMVNESYYDTAFYITAVVEFAIGAVICFKAVSNREIKLPPYTAYHKKRTWPLIATSVVMAAMAALYIYEVAACIQPIEAAEETIETTVKMIYIKGW